MRNGIPLFRFSKPKGPGFGLSKAYYLSVLASHSVLPSLQDLIAPKGAKPIPGTVSLEGFGVPLVNGDDKSLLSVPMTRGQYAIASKSRTTVLRLTVVPRDEAGFDPDAIATSALASQLPEEAIMRIRATWSMLQLTIESHDPDVYPAIDFILGVAQRLAVLADGVVADPISQRYLLPNQVIALPRIDPKVDAREMVSVHFLDRGAEAYVYTRGMVKIVQPEMEMDSVPIQHLRTAQGFLMSAAQGVYSGDLLKSGNLLSAGRESFEVRPGGFEANIWGETPVLELLPPTGSSVGTLLESWQQI